MSARTLVLEVVTPDGIALAERDVDAVVLRRRERRFELGSELAILPLHAPVLIRMPIAPVRYRKGGETTYLALAGGFAEVRGDRVLLLTPRCERIPGDTPSPAAAARELCRAWSRHPHDFAAEMVGAAPDRDRGDVPGGAP
ncbi:hypothetical protein ACOQFB_16840 [Anaeromyxobacter sp. Red801]|uniref:hypothetical protein n=1 Tax=Anaeromyxobacter sp. Red801 TaxID=3411632 RepID=UPI003BA3A06E